MENPTKMDDLGGKPTIFGNIHTPLKINGWNIIPWRFGSDHFPF